MRRDRMSRRISVCDIFDGYKLGNGNTGALRGCECRGDAKYEQSNKLSRISDAKLGMEKGGRSRTQSLQ